MLNGDPDGMGFRLGLDVCSVVTVSTTNVTEAEVVASVACTNPSCGARPGQACRSSGGQHFYPGTGTHRGRWLKLERDLRTGRAKRAPSLESA